MTLNSFMSTRKLHSCLSAGAVSDGAVYAAAAVSLRVSDATVEDTSAEM